MRWANDTKLREKPGRLQQATRAFLTCCRRLGQRVWPFAKTRQPGFNPIKNVAAAPPRLEAGDWADRLAEEKDFLISLVGGMETEFLATGDGLMLLAQQLTEIQKGCQSLTELTLGRTQDAAVQFAFQLLKKSEDLLLASYDQYDHVFATFSELQQRLAQLSKQHDELMRVLLPLNFITILFRIEASRHAVEAQQAFFTLADNVNRTVNEVRRTMERQFNELAASERIARSLMEQLSASIQEHRKEVTATLEASRRQLRAFSEALISSGAGATGLSHQNEAVTRHISGIVMAQQCQDITRQRIEHVGEAMDEMRAHLGDARPGMLATDSETRQFVLHAGQIQLDQVQNVFDQLNRAADSLKSGIQSLRTEAGAAAEVAVKMGGQTLDAKVASQCQAGIGEILGIVRQAVQKIAGILAAFAPLQTSFVDCTGKAAALASDVRRAGLNAQIFAIHAPDGATLVVLAGRVRVISDDVIVQVEGMGTALNHTSEMMNNLRQRLEDFQVLGQAEEDVLTDESALSRKKLSDLEAAIPLLIQRVTRQQGAFAQSVDEVLAKVQFPATVAQAGPRSIGFFRHLVTWGCEGGSRFAVESAASQKIDLLKSNYTMESERHAHAAALQTVQATASAAASQPSIELFGELESPSPTATGSVCEIAAQSERSADPPHPAEVAASKSSPPAPEHSLASEKLGDNVELF
jgi:hypothetical protein